MLSDPKIAITVQQVTNLVVKYLVNFKNTGGLEELLVPESYINETYQNIENAMWPWIIKWLLRRVSGTSYQERMLACPSTVNIVIDVISNKLDDVLGNKSHYCIDAWSGSWIIQLAMNIQARRSWLITDSSKSRGIEINPTAQRVSNMILSKLNVWHVIKWSSTKSENHLGLETEYIHSYGNENLVDSMSWQSGEPFIENLRAFRDSYWESTNSTQFIPSRITFFVSQSARDEKDILKSMPICEFNGNIEKFLDEVDARMRISQESWKKDNRDLFFPSDIQITPYSQIVFLEKLWKEHIWTIFWNHSILSNFEYNNATRWRNNPFPYLNSID